MQLAPHPHIAHIVRHYLVLRGSMSGEATLRLFADGNTGMVFNLNEAAWGQRYWVYGQLSSYHNLVLNGPMNWLIVVLQPWGAYQLWGAAANEWKNAFIPAREALGRGIDVIGARLQQALSVDEAVALLNSWLTAIAGKHQAPDPLLLQAIQQINAAEGSLPIHTLLKQLPLTERTLERKFSMFTGLTPKQYSSIVRITASAKRISRLRVGESLTGIAYESDYFDQSHFINDFKKYTGITPWQYQHSTAKLALNFVRC